LAFILGSPLGSPAPVQGREAIPLTMDKGDALFFDGRTIHGSGKNMTSDQWRRTFICHFVGTHAERLEPPPPAYEEWNAALVWSGGTMRPAEEPAAAKL
jgi:ectoine hydroxylase-related dioxygenase (phytanoyl-CoA dioxygenase family)